MHMPAALQHAPGSFNLSIKSVHACVCMCVSTPGQLITAQRYVCVYVLVLGDIKFNLSVLARVNNGEESIKLPIGHQK